LAAALVIALAPQAGAQVSDRMLGHASVRLVDAQSNAPVARADLLLLRGADTVARSRSDSLGTFSAAGTPGEHFAIEVRRLGYQPTTIRWTVVEGDTAFVIRMAPTAQVLTTVAVAERESPPSRLNGFEYRVRTKAGGTFILREQIDAWHPRQTTDLMRRVLSVKLVDSSGVILAASSRGQKVDLKSVNTSRSMGPCIMRVGVDGQIKEWGFAMDMIDPNSIHGIEVYSGPASIPSEFSGARTDTFCGLVMIWTRSGQ
jgi:hypothetical protein